MSESNDTPEQETAWHLVSNYCHLHTHTNMPETKSFLSSSKEDKKMVAYACRKCCRFSQEQQLRVTSLTIISISSDLITKYWIQRAQHNSSNLCIKLQWFFRGFFFFFVLSHTFRINYYIFTVPLLKFLCNAHSGKYLLSKTILKNNIQYYRK